MSRARSPLLTYVKIITDFMIIYRGAIKHVLRGNKTGYESIEKQPTRYMPPFTLNVSTEDFHVIDVTISNKFTTKPR